MGLDRGQAVQQYYDIRRRAITTFRQADIQAHPLPTLYENIVECHRRQRLLADRFKAASSDGHSISFGECFSSELRAEKAAHLLGWLSTMVK